MENILNEALEIWEIDDFQLNKKKYKGACVYCFYNKVNHKLYIGSSSRLVGRFSNYYRAINGTAKFHSILLKRVFNKYDKKDFLFLILEKIEDKKAIVDREQFYLDKYKPFGSKGYNLATSACSNFGVKHSEETKKAASLRWQGEKSSNAKLKNKDIVGIFNDFAFLDLNYKELGKKYGISHKQIFEIINRNQWSHILIEDATLERVKDKRNKIMSKDDAILIGARLKNGEHPKDISLDLGFPIANIHNINLGLCFAEIKENLSPKERYIYDFKPKNTRDESVWFAIENELKLNKRRCEIVRDLGVSKSLVSEVKKKLNIQKPQRIISLEDAFAVGQSLLMGLGHKEIMETHNICLVSIAKINKGVLFPEVKRHLVGQSLYIKVSKKIVLLSTNKMLVNLIKAGHKDSYIFSQVPVSRSHIVKWRKRYNAKHLQSKDF